MIKVIEFNGFNACLPAKAGIMVFFHAKGMKKNRLKNIF